MKHIAKVLIALLLTATLLFAVSACSDGKKEEEARFPNTQSGFRFEELSEAILEISQDFTLKEENKDGYIPGADLEATVAGYPELSYYDAIVTLTWEYEFLNDDGEYEEAIYETEIELDAKGSGELKEKIEFDEHRSVRNLALSLSFEGYAIKK